MPIWQYLHHYKISTSNRGICHDEWRQTLKPLDGHSTNSRSRRSVLRPPRQVQSVRMRPSAPGFCRSPASSAVGGRLPGDTSVAYVSEQAGLLATPRSGGGRAPEQPHVHGMVTDGRKSCDRGMNQKKKTPESDSPPYNNYEPPGTVPVEVSARRQAQRLQTYWLTKQGIGYTRYSAAVSKAKRLPRENSRWHPVTPRHDAFVSMSVWRKWLGNWRRSIHLWTNLPDHTYERIKAVKSPEEQVRLIDSLAEYELDDKLWLKHQNAKSEQIPTLNLPKSCEATKLHNSGNAVEDAADIIERMFPLLPEQLPGTPPRGPVLFLPQWFTGTIREKPEISVARLPNVAQHVERACKTLWKTAKLPASATEGKASTEDSMAEAIRWFLKSYGKTVCSDFTLLCDSTASSATSPATKKVKETAKRPEHSLDPARVALLPKQDRLLLLQPLSPLKGNVDPLMSPGFKTAFQFGRDALLSRRWRHACSVLDCYSSVVAPHCRSAQLKLKTKRERQQVFRNKATCPLPFSTLKTKNDSIDISC
eukprot:GHVT01006258.1.p1 GENE.GHVT01006258.1~~GHVT01006258.1.p1  ORF type:complete len:534 (+),score=34.07 GHVT01006258.1:355-1956(+)